MKFTFRGVRGSVPSPGPLTARYGGNTTCIEVRTAKNQLIILDAGTGIVPLGRQLPGDVPVDADLFITHSHWDHIQGLPMFGPLFRRGTALRVHGAGDVESGRGIEHVMAVQLQGSYFPVSETALAAAVSYRTLAVGERVVLSDAVVDNVEMCHPVRNLGYRVASGGAALFFSGDHEPWHAAAAAGQAALDAAVAGVDALIMDCTYTREEYAARQGWGHGTFDAAVELALRCGARRLYCTHHEPARTDAQLDAAFAAVMARFAGRLGQLQVFLAVEGETVTLG